MTQALWYLRHAGKVYGPFPRPQIEAALQEGDVGPDWEVSLDEVDWIGLGESGQFSLPKAQDAGSADDASAWRQERLRARQRWLEEGAGLEATAQPHDPEEDARIRQALSADQARTRSLQQQQLARRSSPLVAILGVLLLLLIGYGIWRGQSADPIRTAFDLKTDCAAALADRVNWQGCDKRGWRQPGVRARNARLERTRLDDASLAGADLAYTQFVDASLRNAQLRGASLQGADLSGADLSGADLTGADLRYANLTGARLAGVRLDGARLGKAIWIDGRVCAEGAPGACR